MNSHSFLDAPPAIGANLRKERKQRHLSMDALALASGVSKAMLSQIESDKVNPTIGTVWKIANALDIGLETLLQCKQEEQKKFEVLREQEINTLVTDSSGVRFRVLSPVSLADDLELYLMELNPGSVHSSRPHTALTEEYLTILKGTVRLTVGTRTEELHVGDVAIYQSDVPHQLANPSETEIAALHMTVRFHRK